MQWLDMGKNSAYIWSAYALGVVVLVIVLASLRARRARTVKALGKVLDTSHEKASESTLDDARKTS